MLLASAVWFWRGYDCDGVSTREVTGLQTSSSINGRLRCSSRGSLCGMVSENKLRESDKTCGCCGPLLFDFGVGVMVMVLSNKQNQLEHKPAVVSTGAFVVVIAVVSVVGKGRL